VRVSIVPSISHLLQVVPHMNGSLVKHSKARGFFYAITDAPANKLPALLLYSNI
jgi:hypothetical protein